MTQMKRRLSILLCFLLVFTTVFAVTPTEAKAADTNYAIYCSFGDGTTLTTFKGAKNFYAGDYFYAYNYTSGSEYLGFLSFLNGVNYKSSNSSVASINKSGLLNIKKTGTSTITVTYKKVSRTFNLNVVTEKNFYNTLGTSNKKAYTTEDKAAKSMLKEIGTNLKLTKANRYKLLNAAKNAPSKKGYTSKYDPAAYRFSYYIYSPASYRTGAIKDQLSNTIEKYNPFSTWNAKHFEIKSVNGKGKNVNITLTQKVTDDMIFGANYSFSWDTEIEKSKTYTFPIILQNTSNYRKYYAIATVKSGSNKMTIELKNHKLVKGKTYKLLSQTTISGGNLGNWLDDENKNIINSFKAK